MRYLLVALPLQQDLATYRDEGRGVSHPVAGPDRRAGARAGRRRSAENARPENARYRYDYFTDNCATRVRDALDRALGGAAAAPARRTLAAATPTAAKRCAWPRPRAWMWLGFDVGPRAALRRPPAVALGRSLRADAPGRQPARSRPADGRPLVRSRGRGCCRTGSRRNPWTRRARGGRGCCAGLAIAWRVARVRRRAGRAWWPRSALPFWMLVRARRRAAGCSCGRSPRIASAWANRNLLLLESAVPAAAARRLARSLRGRCAGPAASRALLRALAGLAVLGAVRCSGCGRGRRQRALDRPAAAAAPGLVARAGPPTRPRDARPACRTTQLQDAAMNEAPTASPACVINCAAYGARRHAPRHRHRADQRRARGR